LRQRELVAFAAHRLDEHRELPARRGRTPSKLVGAVAVSSTRSDRRSAASSFGAGARARWRDVTYLPSSLAGEGRGVHAEGHLDTVGSSTAMRGAGVRVLGVGDRVADGDLLDARDGDDVAGAAASISLPRLRPSKVVEHRMIFAWSAPCPRRG
jgi:hypothetical protein